MSGRPTAVIFRKRLLPWSETFIAQQGRALTRYRPLFAGYAYEEGGEAYLAGADTAVLSEHGLAPALGKALAKGFGVLPPAWGRAIAAYDPAIVHAHFGVNALAARPIAKAFSVPLVVTYHGMDITVRRRSGTAVRRQEKVFEVADRIIGVSDFIRDRLLDAGAPPGKVVRHRIGVDTDHFSPGDGSAREPATVLFAGRLVPKKGLEHLLHAMPAVQRAVPGARLLIAGDGPLRADMEAEAGRAGASARFLGVRTPEQVRDLMRRATVFAAPSVVAGDGNAEGLPMTIVEAQACGLPVVGFPSGGSAEGVLEGVTGFMLPPRDEKALAARLAGLLGDPDRRAGMSRAARAHALESFDLHRQTAKLEAIYDEARGLAS
ncbi:MAG TPA: glycosyltransferase [Longimicrobiales bacterium]|nr:glycosyltransferase [Longimicrobiales bacterium]